MMVREVRLGVLPATFQSWTSRYPRRCGQGRGCISQRMQPTSGAFIMPRPRQAGLLRYTPSSQYALQGDNAHQTQRLAWLTPNDSQDTWYTLGDYLSLRTLCPFHHAACTVHTWIDYQYSAVLQP